MASYDESRPRKLSRQVFWSHVLQDIGISEPQHYVGLAGDIAGDIGVLIEWGVHPEQITVFDTAKAAIKSAKHRYPNVPDDTIVEAPVQRGLRRLKRVDGIYLDFGDTIDAGLLRVIQAVASSPNIRMDGYLGVAVTVGTENRKGIFNRAQQEIDSRIHWQLEDAHAYWSLPEAPYLSRALLLTEILSSVRTPGGQFCLERMWTYESRDTGTGAHMLMCSFKKIRKGATSTPFNQLRRALWHPNFRLPGKESASRYLGKLTYLLLEQGKDPKAMLNITKGSEAAYKRLGANNWYA